MFDYSTAMTEQREQATKWLGGVLLAIGLFVYGLVVLTAGHATILARRGFLTRQTIELDGFDAQLYGAALLMGAVAVHCGVFWRRSERYWQVGEIGLAISGVGCALIVFWIIARQFANFI